LSHLDELLSVYLDGETTPAESIRVNRHLADCEACRRRLSDVNMARAALRALPMLELPPNLVAEEKVVPLVRRRSVWMGAAAAVVTVVITVATLVTSPSEPLNLIDVSRQIGARASLDAGSASLKVLPLVSEVND
jgi:anti-sigma factor RsiW